MRRSVKSTVAVLLVLLAATATSLRAAEPARTVKVTVLSTMLAGDRGRGIGEWGFAALLEVDGQRVLIDTGERAETVLKNAAELGIDLSGVTDLFIMHNHGDHTGGLVTLRRELMKKNPRALSRAHVPRGVFYPRRVLTAPRAMGCCRSGRPMRRLAVCSSKTKVLCSWVPRCG